MTWDPLYATILLALAIVAVSGAFFYGLSRLLQSVLLRAGARSPTIHGARDVLRVAWVVVAAVAVIPLLDLATVGTVLTFSGIVGLAVSLALQAVLSNMIAGLLLWRDGAIRIGDVIEYGGAKGTVARVALRNTWVRTASGEIVIIGNSALANGPLLNHSVSERFKFDAWHEGISPPQPP
jgi:small-conductance mechanosensitive channel